jgi:hypothetical protein
MASATGHPGPSVRNGERPQRTRSHLRCALCFAMNPGYMNATRPPNGLVPTGSASACDAITSSAIEPSGRHSAASAGVAQIRCDMNLAAAADDFQHSELADGAVVARPLLFVDFDNAVAVDRGSSSHESGISLTPRLGLARPASTAVPGGARTRHGSPAGADCGIECTYKAILDSPTSSGSSSVTSPTLI